MAKKKNDELLNSPYGLWLSASGAQRLSKAPPPAARPGRGGDRSARTNPHLLRTNPHLKKNPRKTPEGEYRLGRGPKSPPMANHGTKIGF